MGRGQTRMDADKNILIPDSRRVRFLSFSLSTRLGHLASNLARIRSCAQTSAHNATLFAIEESRYFIEWIVPDLVKEDSRVDDAAFLVDVGRGLTHWYWSWSDAQNDPAARTQLVAQAQQWSDEVLAMSGLLDAE
ncbi:MAG: hypothetical protein HZC40_26320 [Chloroflexi bacterium]|nr:hypothetical protein [Chloroflexota bacterium]